MKISVAWLGVIALIAIIVFFSYQIASVTQQTQQQTQQIQQPQQQQQIQKHVRFEEPANAEASVVTATLPISGPAKVVHKAQTNPVPQVPGQTARDLTMDEPLRATPPAKHYDPPESTDPLNPISFQEAEFGSTLRHPEQMIERRPRSKMASVDSGIANTHSSPGGNNAQGYATEMVQNGANFMGSVLAFDGSEAGSAYSLI